MHRHTGGRVSGGQGSLNLSTVARSQRSNLRASSTLFQGKWETLRGFTQRRHRIIFKIAALESGL